MKTGSFRFLKTLGEGILSLPVAVAVRNSGEYIVSDSKGIQSLSPDGTVHRTIARLGTGGDQVLEPQGLWLLSDEDLIVADKGNRRILLLRLSRNGEILNSVKYESDGGYNWHMQSVFGTTDAVYFGEFYGLGGVGRIGILRWSRGENKLSLSETLPVRIAIPKWLYVDDVHIYIIEGRDGGIWVSPRYFSERLWPWFLFLLSFLGALGGSFLQRPEAKAVDTILGGLCAWAIVALLWFVDLQAGTSFRYTVRYLVYAGTWEELLAAGIGLCVLGLVTVVIGRLLGWKKLADLVFSRLLGKT